MKTESITLAPRLGICCPRCGSYGAFEWPRDFGAKYGPGKFYCEECDPGHHRVIRVSPKVRER